MALKEKDFIETEFTGKIKDGEIFDSNIKEDLEKLNVGDDHPIEAKPFVFCLGAGMFLKAIDDFLIGKPDPDTPMNYEIELSPEKAFGNRNPQLVQMIPLSTFKEHDTAPSPGMMFNFDGKMAKVLTISGGRVLVDFNNPLAGKTVVYKIRVLKKIKDINEKIKSFIKFLFKKDLKFEIKDKKLILQTEKQMKEFVELFKDKFKDIFDLELQVKEETKEPKEKKEKEEKK